MSGSKDDDSGLMSSAGLVRYFDAEDKSTPTIDPRTVMAVALLIGFIVIVARFLLLG